MVLGGPSRKVLGYGAGCHSVLSTSLVIIAILSKIFLHSGDGYKRYVGRLRVLQSHEIFWAFDVCWFGTIERDYTGSENWRPTVGIHATPSAENNYATQLYDNENLIILDLLL
jgi:hypothetical protein